MGLVVVGDFLGVEELADVVGVVACRLEPQRKIVFVEASGYEFGVATYPHNQTNIFEIMGDVLSQTMRWIDVRHISVVRAESSPYRNSRGTTQGVRAKVIREYSSLVCNEFSSVWHILQRVHM